MKSYIAFLLALACVFALAGCGGNSVNSTVENDPGETEPAEDALDIAVSYANWTDAGEVYAGSLNREKMAVSIVQHLPIYRFSTLEELEQFKRTFGESLAMDSGYDEVPSFQETTADYDEAFFEENTLMLVYVGANSGSYRYGVDSVFCDGASFCIHVRRLNDPEAVTQDMAGWWITVAVPDSMIETCTAFDADLNNRFYREEDEAD